MNKKGDITFPRVIGLILFVIILIIMGFGPFLSTVQNTVGWIFEIFTGYNPFPGDEEVATLPPGNYSAEVEFEENSFFVHNIIYRFDNGKWMWKCPTFGTEYLNYRLTTDNAVEERMTDQFKTMTIALRQQGEAEGLALIQRLYNIYINENPSLTITYTNNCQFKTVPGKKITSPSLYEIAKDPNEPIAFDQNLRNLGSYSGENCPA